MPGSNIKDKIAKCQSESRAALVTFMTCGYPDKDSTVKALLAMEKSGSDIIEVGVPFSDPTAEGGTIQVSSKKALDNKTTMTDCFNKVDEARKAGLTVPVILMGYYNNWLAHGLEKVCQDSKRVGVDGFIIVDLPPEEGHEFLGLCKKYELSYVPLVAPTSTPARVKKLVSMADSMVYVVSTTGVTGARATVSHDASATVNMVRDADPDVNVVVGFGVSNRGHVEELAKQCDGVVVGSAIVKALGNDGIDAMGELIKDLAGGLAQQQSTEPPTKRHKTTENGVDEGRGDDWNFGKFGGRYIPETLMHAHEELEKIYLTAKQDPSFHAELDRLRREFIGGPTPIYHAKNLTEKCGGAQIWFKREELAHTGAHKINNSIGQALLAKKIGKKRIIAETGAGQHGVATATACALLGLDCTVYMGAVDTVRQALNVFRMKMMGAKVVPVHSGSKTLKDAVNEAMRDWVTNVRDTHYIIGSAVGPHPFPDIVRDLQAVISKEAKEQMLNQGNYTTKGPGKMPDVVVACVGGGSNAIGMFTHFLDDKDVKLVGVEAGGEKGPPPAGNDMHSATLTHGVPGVLHGARTYVQQDAAGNVSETHSISAGLDYPGVGPQHAHLKDSGRVEYVYATDSEALDALQVLSRTEGILPALEPSHAVAYVMKLAKTMPKDKIILMNLCGRGDKDMVNVAKHLGISVE